MFIYDKALQYPVKIQNTNPKLASIIISQYGGPDGELGASLRYLSQRYSMPTPELKGLLTDIGAEESEMLRPPVSVRRIVRIPRIAFSDSKKHQSLHLVLLSFACCDLYFALIGHISSHGGQR